MKHNTWFTPLVFAVMLLWFGLGSGLSVSTPSPENGMKIYKAKCAVCHGNTAEGKGRAANLTSKEVQGKSDDELLSVIRNGKQGTMMPPFKNKLKKPGEIEDVLTYIRSLDASPLAWFDDYERAV